jgi:trk system potassium uptake protein TrkA
MENPGGSMNITIVGGGKVGFYLAKTLIPNEHKITLIELDRQKCEELANDLSIEIIHGDGTNIETLRRAGAEKADNFISLTGKDQINLVACQLAKRSFGILRTIARVNNPKNIEIFKELGVDMAISSTSIIADSIEQEVDYKGLKTVSKMKDNEIILSEINIKTESQVCGKRIMDFNIPKQCIITSIIRNEKFLIPNGQTVLENGDTLIVVSETKDQFEIGRFFLGEI